VCVCVCEKFLTFSCFNYLFDKLSVDELSLDETSFDETLDVQNFWQNLFKNANNNRHVKTA